MTRLATAGFFLLAPWLLATPVVLAAPTETLFAQGVTAFKAGNYATALRYFQQAQAAGFNQPTLFYNLGVSYYKLGRYAEAEEAFRAVARTPQWAPLAYYNMGLAAYQRGEHTAAAVHFQRAWRDAEDEKLRTLALMMSERVDIAATRRPPPNVALSLGYDSNVTLTTDSRALQTSQESDLFVELSVFATGRWDDGRDGRRWDAGFYSLKYEDVEGFDLNQLLLGADKLGTIGAWRTGLSGQWQYLWFDGRGFLQIASLRLEGLRELPDERDLRLSLQVNRIDEVDAVFEFLSGWSQELDVSTAQRAGDGRLRWGLTLEFNQREDLMIGSEFFSQSPTRYTVWLDGSWPVAERWSVEPVVRYSRSRYADPDRRENGLVRTRADEQVEFTLRLGRRLRADWHLVGEYSYIDNDSNFNTFSYARYLAMIRLVRPF
jgi:tetratricopeptide (TPR) repeat protein